MKKKSKKKTTVNITAIRRDKMSDLVKLRTFQDRVKKRWIEKAMKMPPAKRWGYCYRIAEIANKL